MGSMAEEPRKNRAGQGDPGAGGDHSPRQGVRLAAVGDLLLSVDPRGREAARDGEELFAEVRGVLTESHVVFGNLECALPGDGATVGHEAVVVSTEALMRSVRTAGFTVVTLANNHTFDCLEGGCRRVRRVLEELGVAAFGAGENLAEAEAPAIVEAGGQRMAFLGAADRASGAPFLAAANHWGVAPLDVERLTGRVRELRGECEHVLVSLHWGEERFRIPSPRQMVLAHRLVDAGATMILGHHPHVLQGLERYNGGVVIYSLGNFAAGSVYFTDGDVYRWRGAERAGCILRADLRPGGVEQVSQVPTWDTGQRVVIDASGRGQRVIEQANRALAHGVTERRYRREALRVKVILPTLSHLRWSRLKHLRFRTVRNALARLARVGAGS